MRYEYWPHSTVKFEVSLALQCFDRLRSGGSKPPVRAHNVPANFICWIPFITGCVMRLELLFDLGFSQSSLPYAVK